MTAPGTDAWLRDATVVRQEPGRIARAALLLFSVFVPLDALTVPGMSIAVMGAGLMLLVAGALEVIRTRAWHPIPAPLLWLLAFTCWSAGTMLWAHDLEPSLLRVLTYAQLVASVWAAWQVARSRLDARIILAGFVIGCCGASVGTWWSFLHGITQVEMKFGPDSDIQEARFVALGFDPNEMGLTLALGIVMAGYLGLAGTGRWQRLWLAYLPLALSAIALSGSRGSAVAGAIAIAAVLLWMVRQSVRAAVVTMTLLAAGAAVAWLETPQTWERIFTLRQQLAGGSLGERLPIWHAGWHLFLENPILGVGVAGFQSAVVHGLGYPIVAHNTPLSVATETGLIGLVLFYGAPMAIAWASRLAPRAERSLVLGLLATWFVGTAALTWEYRKTTWLVMLIGAAICELARDPSTAENP